MENEIRSQEIDLTHLGEIIGKYQGQEWSLIPLLQEVQDGYGYIPLEGIKPIADRLGLFPSQVQGVITFYTGLYTTPRGKNVVKVCRGTACHVRGGKTILKLVKRYLDVDEGETTPDFKYTLETVACIGVCALAPNLVINNETYGQLNPKKVTKIFSSRESEG